MDDSLDFSLMSVITKEELPSLLYIKQQKIQKMIGLWCLV